MRRKFYGFEINKYVAFSALVETHLVKHCRRDCATISINNNDYEAIIAVPHEVYMGITKIDNKYFIMIPSSSTKFLRRYFKGKVGYDTAKAELIKRQLYGSYLFSIMFMTQFMNKKADFECTVEIVRSNPEFDIPIAFRNACMKMNLMNECMGFMHTLFDIQATVIDCCKRMKIESILTFPSTGTKIDYNIMTTFAEIYLENYKFHNYPNDYYIAQSVCDYLSKIKNSLQMFYMKGGYPNGRMHVDVR